MLVADLLAGGGAELQDPAGLDEAHDRIALEAEVGLEDLVDVGRRPECRVAAAGWRGAGRFGAASPPQAAALLAATSVASAAALWRVGNTMS